MKLTVYCAVICLIYALPFMKGPVSIVEGKPLPGQRLKTQRYDQAERISREKSSESSDSEESDSSGGMGGGGGGGGGGSTCPSGWILNGTSCYILIKGSDVIKTWNAARNDCLAMDADLVKIDNAEEQLFTDSIVGGSYNWILLNDKQKEGYFVWGSPGNYPSFVNWYSGQQPGNQTADHDCVYSDPYYGWATSLCDSLRFSYICERPAECESR